MNIKSYFIAVFLVFLSSTTYAEKLPLCIDLAEKTEISAARCAPIKTPPNMANDTLRILDITKYEYGYYIVLGPQTLTAVQYCEKEMSSPCRDFLWKILDLAVSSIQSLYNENENIYVLKTPSKSDRQQMSIGKIPQEIILAEARYDLRKQDIADEIIYAETAINKPYMLIIH